MKSREKAFESLLKFRSAMGLSLSLDQVKYVWGRRFLREMGNRKDGRYIEKLEEIENENISKKVAIAKKNIPKLLLFNWVQFIGISGSVGAGFAKKEDDIDIFVVVRNGTMWIYRAIIVFRNLFHNKIRAKRHKNVKNKLCVNLICEERGLQFPNDIFNFHELIFLKPIYKKKYKRYVLSKNKWLRKEFFVKKELLRSRVVPKRKVLLPIRVINFCAFIAQLIFMLVSKHNPEVKRLKQNFKEGKIEFFEADYRKKSLQNYSK